MLRLLCVLVLATIATAQLFGGGTHEHAVLGTFSFFYDPTSHYLIGRSRSNCYFMSLSASEQHDVHTGTGLEHEELKMIQMLDGGEDELTSDQTLHHAHIIDYMCYHHKLFMVGDVSTRPPRTTMTTTSAPTVQ